MENMRREKMSTEKMSTEMMSMMKTVREKMGMLKVSREKMSMEHPQSRRLVPTLAGRLFHVSPLFQFSLCAMKFAWATAINPCPTDADAAAAPAAPVSGVPISMHVAATAAIMAESPNPPTSLIFLCARWKLLGPTSNDYRCPAAAQTPHGRCRGAPAPLGRARAVPARLGGALQGNTGRREEAHVCADNLQPIAGSLAHIESFPARGRPAPRWKAEKVWVPAGYLTLACAKPIRSQAAPYEDLGLIWITLVLNRASF